VSADDLRQVSGGEVSGRPVHRESSLLGRGVECEVVVVVSEPDPNSPAVAYHRMRWNTPLSEDHADLLIQRLGVEAADLIADLGCGWGQFLVRAFAKTPTSRGLGVDNAEWAVTRGQALAIEYGLADRVAFVTEDASRWTESADRLVCIGASHAWVGSAQALQGLRNVVRPGGRVVFGDGCWEQAPTSAASQLFGDDVLPLGALVDEAIHTGWTIRHLSTADQREWDDFESTWRSGREQWLLSNTADPRAPELRAELDQRLRDYLTVYRGVLGFVFLVLAC
jgi:cyclopropane fatty-acyl-phospholipid synthase-like methyltransferase